MKPEEEARKTIDSLLSSAGWVVQEYRKFNIGESLGVAIRDFPLGKDTADYLLDRSILRVVDNLRKETYYLRNQNSTYAEKECPRF